MSYLALYRKYRPQTFDDLIGQPHVARALRNAVREGRIAHAYLFTGPRGTGKTTTARLLAKALNCGDQPTPEPCGRCEPCRRIMEGSALDVIEIDAASKTSVDDIRELRERVQTAPVASRYKVYIVDEVHMLSTSAFNAFLKTLEEPPRHVIFVLCTTEPHKLPATVLSRCQRYDFHRLAADDLGQLVRKVAQQEDITLDDAAVTMLVRAAWGSARDALSLLEQAVSYAGRKITAADIQAIVGGADISLLADFADAVAERDVDRALHLVARAADEGRDLRQLATDLVEHFRDLLLLRVCRRADELVVLPEQMLERVRAQAQKMPEDEIIHAAQVLSDAERELRRSEQQRLTLELAMVRLTAPAAAPAPVPAQPAKAPRRVRAQAGAAGSAEAEAAPPTGAIEASLESLRQQWPALLEKLRAQRQAGVAAFLAESEPQEVTDDRLVLAFKHEFHFNQMKNPERRKIISDLLAQETGRQLAVECRLWEGGQSSGQGGDDGVKNIMNMFPGSEIV